MLSSNSVILKESGKIDWNYALLITLTSVVPYLQLIYDEHEHNFDTFCSAAVPMPILTDLYCVLLKLTEVSAKLFVFSQTISISRN